MITSQERLLTANDLWKMPDDGKIYELHSGVLVEMPGSGERQSALAMWIGHLLINFIMQNELGGQILGADGTMVLSPFNTRIPDVAYLSAANVGGNVGYHTGAPDLAVEVLSPSNSATEMQQRVGDYLTAGTRLVWIVDPDGKTVDVYHPDGIRYVLTIQDKLVGDDVLPGLALSIETMFRPFGQAL